MTVTVHEPDKQRLPAKARSVIAILLVAAFVVILNETIMGVALPRLMTELSLPASTVQWLSTAFMLTMAVVIPTTGFLLQRISTRTVFLIAMSLFCAGTLIAGLAPGFWLLLPARIVQASGTAMMVPLLMTSILTLVPIERRGSVMGNVSIAISVAPAIGPTLSGLILQFLSWRFMFLLVLPIALLALALGARRLDNIGEREHQKLDWISVLLSIPAFGGIVYGLSRFAVSSGSGIGVAVGGLALGLISLALFIWRQIQLQRGRDPLLDLRAFRFPMFRISVVLLCIAMIGLFGAIILLPIYLQNIRGLGSLETGILLLPGGLLMGLLAPTVGRIFDRFGPRVLVPPGALLIVLTLLGLTQADDRTPIWMLLGLHVLLCLGFASMFTPAFTSGLNPLPPSLYSHGSAIMATFQQVAGAAGTALLVTIMAGRTISLTNAGTPQLPAEISGLHTAFAVAVGVGVVALILAFFLKNTKPAAPPGAAPDAVPAEASEAMAADR